jgi:hypothetical protein
MIECGGQLIQSASSGWPSDPPTQWRLRPYLAIRRCSMSEDHEVDGLNRRRTSLSLVLLVRASSLREQAQPGRTCRIRVSHE